ncbi:MAG: right-handed parallel beta-helix repeat-containing protein, partial [Polyangiales bacterium]
MTWLGHRTGFTFAVLGVVVLLAAGCGAESGSAGLSVDVSFAPGVPRAARDESVRVEVYLVDSCDSVTMGERPDDTIDSMFVLRDGSAGPAIGIPDPGNYGLYAVAQDSNCAVVGAGCDEVSIDAAPLDSYAVELGAFSGEGCFANQQCSIETGECSGPSGDCVDLDSDGLGDGTRDNVGCVNATTDSNDDDGMVCADTDGDSCDDCSSGSFDPLDDGTDTDSDGVCDAGDVCVDSDGDGLGDGTLANAGCIDPATDSNDDDGMVCADSDGDGCDDCSSGSFDPLDDGVDGDADGICDSGDVCVDSDGDGLGNGTLGNGGCVDATTDSNDGDGAVCADTDSDSCDDCSSGSFDPLDDGPDADSDGICDAGDVCVDSDGDGLGDGTGGNVGCASTTTDSNVGVATICADTDGDGCDDCSTGSFDPLDDGVDSDADGICDSGDDCVDGDGDGLGDGTLGNAGCVDTTTDSNDGDGSVCADTDGDSCDDCAIATFDPSNDGLDADGDGVCALGDCDDDKPLCAAVCTDDDDDGYCIDSDCDDAVPTCALDCTTNSDGDPQVDCFETFCGTNPNSGGSRCLVATSELSYETALDSANDTVGHDYIVVGDFTMTQAAPKLDDDAGVTIRQLAGATLTVNSGGDRLVFEVSRNNNVIDGVHVVNVSNLRDIALIQGNNNTVQNCVFEGFERRGIFVNGGDNAQILDNIVTGGTDAQTDEVAAIIIKDSLGSVVAGNTVGLNAMDGVQIRKVTGLMVDHNTIADNGGSGVKFYGDDSSGVCLRNNNVTGNADFGLNADRVVT